MKTLSYLKGMRTKYANRTGKEWFLHIDRRDFINYIVRHRMKGKAKNTFRLEHGWALTKSTDQVFGWESEPYILVR